MAIKIERTTQVQVGDNVTISVTDLPADAQHIVDLIDDWRQEEQDTRNKLLLVQSALAHAQATLTSQIQSFLATDRQPPTPAGDQ